MRVQSLLWMACIPAIESNAQLVNFSYDHAGNQILSVRDGALPVRLVYFNASRAENAVTLAWRTATEDQSDYFGIERSSDGKSWNELAVVTAAGSSETAKSYTWLDLHPVAGSNWYRIRIMDLDGTKEYTPIRNVPFKGEIRFGPNPVSDALSVYGIKDTFALDLFAPDGKKLLSIPRLSSGIPIDLRGFPPGLYFFRLTETDGKTSTYRIVKE
ncbi:hypothetical protein GCM10023091_21210 [Ravibacter arvi]|uniref:Secretion system C-terminal sorting domain-containing protein n=1 Tax=Ravibacter arvi TaxID=2051041 RepID=A0ABP8LYX1_9BACT